MTIDEIKSVSIYHWMKENGYGKGLKKGKNVFYNSPLRSERTPSFVVNTKDNLWHDFGDTGKGGNLINLVAQLNPCWSSHQVLSFLEKQIIEKKLEFNEDHNARIQEEEEKKQWIEEKRAEREASLNQETIVDMIIPLSHPHLRDYIIQRHIDYNIAQKYCKEVHYTIRGKSYYAIAFMNIVNGIEARNKLNKRCIGKKSISVIYPMQTPQKQCCVFEGFFDMLSYLTIETWMPDLGISIGHPCDYFVLNGVGEAKLLLPYLREYSIIHCFLDNDEPGMKTTKFIKESCQAKVEDDSYKYKNYNDLNDFIAGNIKK